MRGVSVIVTRILFYSDRNGIYGAERINQEIVLALKTHGCDIAIALPRGNNVLTDQLDEAGVERFELPEENVYDSKSLALSLTDQRISDALFDQWSPDFIFFGDGFPFSSLAAKHTAIDRSIPFLSLVHVVDPKWSREFALLLPSLSRAFASAKQVIAVSEDNLGLLRRFYGLSENHGTVIYNGRPEKFFAPRSISNRSRFREQLGISQDAVVAITVGRFDHEKGYDLLLDALPLLRKHPCWKSLRMLWVGDGHLRRRAEQLARLLSGEQVISFGESHEISDLLNASDFLVHPSRAEGLPLVVLEAMAKGLPVVGTRVG
jgi:glycosyltransferase involved in cell wall biosynthesis